MGETRIQIGLISARQLLLGAGFGCSLLKHQWYAIGWINPKDKFCTTINASRSDNPVWGTKFFTSLDDNDSKTHTLHVEVYSGKKLHGSVTLPLKQFLAKFKNQSSSSSVFEETISCQLRKQNSNKPRGFVYVSIRISADYQDFGDIEGPVRLSNNSGYNSSGQNDMAGSSEHPFATSNQPNSSNSFSFPPDNHHFPMPNPLTNNASPQTQQPYYPPPPPMHQPYNPLPPMQQPNYPHPQMQESYYPPPPMQQPNYPHPQMQEPNYPHPQMQEPYYPPPPMQQPYCPSAPPLPPATSNAGYIPSYILRSDNAVNIPSSSSSSGGNARPGSAGLEAGTIVAGDPAFHGRDVYLT